MPTLTLPAFAPDRPAREAHAALLAADRATDRARHCAVLWFGEILRRGLFRELGYASMPQYAKTALGFSASKTTDFMTLARKLDALPAVRASLAAGRIGYTKAREVVKVATPRTEAAWEETARTRSRAELAQRVRQVKALAKRRKTGQLDLVPPAAKVEELAREAPVREGVVFTPEQHARWEALWEKARKLGGLPVDRAEVLLEAIAALVEKAKCASDYEKVLCSSSAPRGALRPPVQIHVHKCAECGRIEAGGRALGRVDAERVQCDAAVASPGKRNTTTIPPRTRRAVLARDRHRCRAPGCGRTRFLEIHHVVPRTHGGTNTADNLITLCSACHRFHHERGEPAVPAGPDSVLSSPKHDLVTD